MYFIRPRSKELNPSHLDGLSDLRFEGRQFLAIFGLAVGPNRLSRRFDSLVRLFNKAGPFKCRFHIIGGCL